MSKKLNSEIAVIGIDIGKNSFHLVGQDRQGALVLRQKWSRGQVEARLANLPPCLIGMEACVGAHHLSRKLKALGHDARLMPAKYVRPYSIHSDHFWIRRHWLGGVLPIRTDTSALRPPTEANFFLAEFAEGFFSAKFEANFFLTKLRGEFFLAYCRANSFLANSGANLLARVRATKLLKGINSQNRPHLLAQSCHELSAF